MASAVAATYLFIGWVTSDNKARVYRWMISSKTMHMFEVELCFV